jgi:hypothetical protein
MLPKEVLFLYRSVVHVKSHRDCAALVEQRQTRNGRKTSGRKRKTLLPVGREIYWVRVRIDSLSNARILSLLPRRRSSSTMWTFNPAVYMRHAWDKTNSWWGKMSLVLFYLFIWLGIIKSVYGVIDPTCAGVFSCMMTDLSSFQESLVLTMVRGWSLFSLAFLIYADKGGLHTWNVGIVACIMLAWVWMAKTGILDTMEPSMLEECVGWMSHMVWILPVWIIVTFVGVVVDEKMGDGASVGEREPLTFAQVVEGRV